MMGRGRNDLGEQHGGEVNCIFFSWNHSSSWTGECGTERAGFQRDY